jgi:TolA-binding protein
MHRKPLLSALPAVVAAALLLALPQQARAQAESREGIFLQNQILELRQELEQLRARGPAAPAPQPARGGSAPASAGASPELVSGLLDRVSQLEEQVRRQRGQIDESENRIRQLQAQVEKLQGDMDYRLGQLEGGNRPTTPAAVPTPAPAGRPTPQGTTQGGTLTPPPAPAAGNRTPERALAEGQAALNRREFEAAETAAREVLANRNHPRTVDAQLLLADSLAGRRNWGAAAVAYDDAYKRARNGARAPEALVGLANSFMGLNSRREVCETLDELNSNFPNLRGVNADRAAQMRSRAGCR